MKQILQIVGVITLVVGSFMFTEEVGTTAKLSDELLNEINEKKNDYIVPATESTIKNNTIISGQNGKQVDVKASYHKMKQIGYFNDKLLVYKSLPVKDNLKSNVDKYVIGANPNEKSISLLFKVKNNTNINKIVGALDKQKIKGTFYITSKFLENNQNLVIQLLEKNYTIGNLSDNGDYTDSDFLWMKTTITGVGTQKYNYCYTEKPNKQTLKTCKIQKSYTIIPSTIIKERPFINVKDNLGPGKLITLEVNEELNNEIENIINYVISKGYQIKSLEKVLQE